MKYILALALAAISSICARASTNAAAPAAVADKLFLFETARHLYRWYLDENDVERGRGATVDAFWVRALHPALDAGDRSEFAEVVMPGFCIKARFKRSDYSIEEVGERVQSGGFKITNVSRSDIPDQPDGYRVVETSRKELVDYLFSTRTNTLFPDQAMHRRFTGALRRQMGIKSDDLQGAQTVYLAPLSPVANEWWCYWENRKLLLRFTSDIDLAKAEVWDREELAVRVFDVYNQVVVSMDEAPGSNIFMTRDQIGRALFVCIVMGRRVDLQPERK